MEIHEKQIGSLKITFAQCLRVVVVRVVIAGCGQGLRSGTSKHKPRLGKGTILDIVDKYFCSGYLYCLLRDTRLDKGPSVLQ